MKGNLLFSGYSIAWTVLLAAGLYGRARAHKEVLQRQQPPNWALSGQDRCHDRALALDFTLSSNTMIDLLNELSTYLRHLQQRFQYPGLPPSLLYARFDSRSEYLRCMLSGHPDLLDLLKVVQKMVCYGL